MLRSNDFNDLPLDADDEQLNSHLLSKLHGANHERWTEMSPSLLNYRAGVCQRRLTELGFSASLSSSPGEVLNIQRCQLSVLEEFNACLQSLTDACASPLSQIQRFTLMVGHESATTMRLFLSRPLYRRTKLAVTAVPEMDVLRTATEVLERNQMKQRKEFSQWAWFRWIKWYALAVVLAELCTTTEPQAEISWNVAKQSYNEYAETVADTKIGLLWKPIHILMKRVLAIRKARSAETNFAVGEEGLPYTPLTTTFVEDATFGVEDLQLLPHLDTELPSSVILEQMGNSLWSWDLLLDDLNNGVF